MQFKSDGTLKIMQITDMQEIPAISPDTLALLDAAVEAEHPDLVIYTGDQIKGYGVTYKGKTKKELEAAVAKTITALLGNYFTAKFADVSAINYIVLGLTMATNMITEFLYDKFVVFRGQENTAVSKKDKKKA